jgi:hypothetical protein
MRNTLHTLALLAAVAAGALFTATASAQVPYPSDNYTRDRAYRHFLNSPSPVKTFSSLSQRYEWGYDTPLESGRFYYTTPYYHQRISPRGFESYQTPPQSGGVIEYRPPPVIYVPAPPPYPYGPVYRPW